MFGLYLHIPYCEGKCFYCDFYSRGGSRSVPDAYVDALLREWERFSGAQSTNYSGQACRRTPQESPCGTYGPLPQAPGTSSACNAFRSFPDAVCRGGGTETQSADFVGQACRRTPRESPCGPCGPLPQAPGTSSERSAFWSRPDTVYFGGGTPSLLSPAQVARLLDAAAPAPGAEITLEANPDTVTAASLAGYRRAGVNRLSLGVQSASDAQLARLGRPHDAAAARRALALARDAGFENISGDLMLALPGYSLDELKATIALLVEGGVTHISSYLLKIEPHTRFGLHPPADLPDDDAAADFYLAAVALLADAGFTQYEISNFARPGFASRHNLIYWDCGDYLGLGPAAYSCLSGRRFHCPPDLAAFLAGPAAYEPDGCVDAADYIMLQTRLASGLSLAALQSRCGVVLSDRQRALLAACEKNGLCRLEDGRLCLTPRGMLVQNSLLTEVF